MQFIKCNSGVLHNPRFEKTAHTRVSVSRAVNFSQKLFSRNFHREHRELKPPMRESRSYFLRQAVRALVTGDRDPRAKTSLSSYRASENCGWRARRGYSGPSTRKLILLEFLQVPLSGRYKTYVRPTSADVTQTFREHTLKNRELLTTLLFKTLDDFDVV